MPVPPFGRSSTFPPPPPPLLRQPRSPSPLSRERETEGNRGEARDYPVEGGIHYGEIHFDTRAFRVLLFLPSSPALVLLFSFPRSPASLAVYICLARARVGNLITR